MMKSAIWVLISFRLPKCSIFSPDKMDREVQIPTYWPDSENSRPFSNLFAYYGCIQILNSIIRLRARFWLHFLYQDSKKKYMHNINLKRILGSSLILTSLFLTNVSLGQKYKTISDTTRLNKECGEISLEIAKLNTKLIEAKNKTVDYRSKTSSTAGDAVVTAQASKDQASVATDGNTTDTKKAVRDAKEANKKANDAKDAVSDEKKNNKKINELTAQIDQKQKLLRDLDSQRAVIMANSTSAPIALADSLP